ncbi:MAG: hypothetical protein LBE91_09070 [Tannerella sp.]|nr:hypothetical protein [Tannerella sp.]
MKNFLKKKSKLTKIIAIFAPLLLIVFYACVKEELDLPFSDNEETQTIEQVKAWYADRPDEIVLRSSDGKGKLVMTPDWETVYTLQDKKYKMVEVNLMSYGRIGFYDEDCMKKYDETKDPNYLQSYTHLVFRINKSTKDTVAFLMTMMADVEWLEESKLKPFLESSYLYRAKKFGGTILYHNLDGSFANGWVYEKGKIVASVSAVDESGSIDVELRSTSCHYETIYVAIQNCTDLYFGTEMNGVLTNITYNGTHCTTTYGYITVQVCDDGSNGLDPGEYNPNNTGGNGGSTPKSPGTRTDCPPSAAANSTTANSVLNSTSGGAAQVKSNVDLLRNHAKNSSNEYGLVVNKDGSQYTLLNLSNNYTTIPNNPYIVNGGATYVNGGYTNNTYLLAHTHPGGSGHLMSPSPADAIALADAYKGNTGKSGSLVRALNIQGSVILGADGSEYMIYVQDRDALKAFCDPTNSLNSSFFQSSGADFQTNSIFASTYTAAYNNLRTQGYSIHDANSYALSYVLDHYHTGLKISKKEPGKTDFKEQKTEGGEIGKNYLPKKCP